MDGEKGVALLTVFVTIGLIQFIKYYGNLKPSIITIGIDLNLLTYGFLWDTSLKGLLGKAYWPTYPNNFPNKNILLLIIFCFNFVLMLINFKIEKNYVEIVSSMDINPTDEKSRKKFFLTVFNIAIGILSLLIFIELSSIWN